MQLDQANQANQANVHPQAEQDRLTFAGSIFWRNNSYFYRRLQDGSCPQEFSRLLARDKNDHPESDHLCRYSDILGHDAKLALRVLAWSYVSRPISVGVFAPNGHLVSIAYATLISFEDGRLAKKLASHTSRRTGTQRTAVNLSYAVSAQYEGQGLAFVASCLVIKLAAQQWPTLDHHHDINIQTKASNAPSLALAARLGALPCPEADFSISHPDESVHRYTGFRSPWPDMVATADSSLTKFLVLADCEFEDTDYSNDSPSPSL